LNGIPFGAKYQSEKCNYNRKSGLIFQDSGTDCSASQQFVVPHTQGPIFRNKCERKKNPIAFKNWMKQVFFRIFEPNGIAFGSI